MAGRARGSRRARRVMRCRCRGRQTARRSRSPRAPPGPRAGHIDLTDDRHGRRARATTPPPGHSRRLIARVLARRPARSRSCAASAGRSATSSSRPRRRRTGGAPPPTTPTCSASTGTATARTSSSRPIAPAGSACGACRRRRRAGAARRRRREAEASVRRAAHGRNRVHEDWHYEINIADLPTAAPIAAGAAERHDQRHERSMEFRSADLTGRIARRLPVDAVGPVRAVAGRAQRRERPSAHERRRVPIAAALVARRATTGVRHSLADRRAADRHRRGQRAAQVVASDPAAIVAPAWSHDGRSVYFGSNARRRLARLAGGYRRRRTAAGHRRGRICRVRVARRSIAVLHAARAARPLAAADSRGTRHGSSTEAIEAEDWPNVAAVDGGIYFVTNPDDGDPQLAMLDERTNQTRLLARLPAFAWSGVAVSRDGAHVSSTPVRTGARANIVGLLRNR